ncbi:winged helix-turn-helix transcriptional regulator [Streptomyces sp. ID05-04B]|uniref:winged helix-turn-helix transcriptional regulator n=1 Tax=Streptomyces sp. ID05-04B TaxID=3028661 RepID=UPI0029C35826|nr:winged helix-turn-helix transcriptional regulator [Streptomyces sp. ID05-04B]MDX5562707.1 winged helix-turn-helix transcriptional regulator [Streptomyces sp. ID05-04B]
MTTARTYGQMCPLARSMDVLGERWTFLIVRELLLGPKRFKDLGDSLPALGPNRLTARLRGLEDAGVVRRTTLPPPAGVAVYELTERGEGLREPLGALGRWGLGLPPSPDIDTKTTRVDLIALSVSSVIAPDRLVGLKEIYEMHVGKETFHVEIADGRMRTRSGPAPVRPDLEITCRVRTFLKVIFGGSRAADAVRSGELQVAVGSEEVVERAFDLLSGTEIDYPVYLGV